MSTEQAITFSGDASSLLKAYADIGKAIEKMKKGTKETAEEGEKASKSMAQTVEMMAIKWTALSAVVRGVGAAIKDAAETSVNASKGQGGRNVSTAASLAKLGVKDIGALQAEIDQGGENASAEQLAALVQGLAGTGKKLSDDDVRMALSFARTRGEIGMGAGFADLIKGVQEGRTVSASGRRALAARPGLGTESWATKAEMETRAAEDQRRAASEERSGQGYSRRQFAAQTEADGSFSRAYMKFVEEIPGVGKALADVSRELSYRFGAPAVDSVNAGRE
jgi:hypothetical protein